MVKEKELQPTYQYLKELTGKVFLKVTSNKDDLFQFFSEQLSEVTVGKTYTLIITKETSVLSNTQLELSALYPCKHEDADTRMMLHLQHAAANGQERAYFRTFDTDVVILVVFHLETLGLTELWIGFGSGKTFKEISIHTIHTQLGEERCKAILMFHSFTVM